MQYTWNFDCNLGLFKIQDVSCPEIRLNISTIWHAGKRHHDIQRLILANVDWNLPDGEHCSIFPQYTNLDLKQMVPRFRAIVGGWSSLSISLYRQSSIIRHLCDHISHPWYIIQGGLAYCAKNTDNYRGDCLSILPSDVQGIATKSTIKSCTVTNCDEKPHRSL